MQNNLSQQDAKKKLEKIKKDRERELFNMKVANDEAKEKLEKDREFQFKES